MKPKRERDQPDAFIYRDDAGKLQRFCRHCTRTTPTEYDSDGPAFREAQMHLWTSHSRRFVWVDFSDPRYASMVQTALPIIIAHNTTRAN